jgi:2-polyprenyl-3-methyl-5-hydroxy-6-metoxy-1,4-benzoquinol methylase
MTTALVADQPQYDRFVDMEAVRGPLAAGFARQILATCRPFLPKPAAELRVLDIGCGYGHTARELARQTRHVVGIEPCQPLVDSARQLGALSGLPNLEYRAQGIYELADREAFDLVVLDNVLEHLPDQPQAIEIISQALAPGGAAYILVPNRLWPIEVHYRLPFLSYLPLSLANVYLRMSGRGADYTDASYSPTYWRLNRLLRARPELRFSYVLPADLALTTTGNAWHYRLGVAALRRWPCLWAISKAFLVVAKKLDPTARS